MLSRLVVYTALIQRWNRRKRIVGNRDLSGIVGVHLADAIALAGRLQLLAPAGQTLLDVGSGAGLPGLAVALLIPELHTVLCEVSEKRVSFLHHARQTLDVEVEILHEDVHLLMNRGRRFDHVVSRAVFEPPQWVAIGKRCVHTAGRLWCMLTARQQESYNIQGEAFRYSVDGDRDRVLLCLQGPDYT
jgi:16S rRNA (guanine527-N7)-methyltransferase